MSGWEAIHKVRARDNRVDGPARPRANDPGADDPCGLDPRPGASPLVYLGLYPFAMLDGFFPPVPSERAIIALAALSISGSSANLARILISAAAGAFTGDQIAYRIGSRVDVR